ncbi:MAG: hypothetical protein LLG20_22745 [Acidobacteriales bacterium]|nr:hypothetical protein [Terriglobales bacterium]
MSSDTQTLILSGQGYELAIAPEAEAQKAELLKHSALIVEVNDPDANQAALIQVKKLAAMRNAVEKSRNIVKAPVLQVGRDIDAKAKDFVAAIDAEEKRVSKLVATYAEAVERERQRIARELEAKRQAEEKARREAEAAAAKAAAEAAAAAAKAQEAEWEDDEETKRQAAEEAAKREAEAAAAKAAEEAAKSRPILDVVPAKASGVKFVHDFEVLEICHLAFQQPRLVKMEPKRSEILEFIKERIAEGVGEDDPSWANIGLRIVKKPIVSTR